eukprot:CAMPEP_0197718264 /NCGR_PEP_ID=MMETSP1434-20131217/2489_1 /TAXON_ID=265543 /ORGANISM="Minutocellus polymorphus, Strain CCMP3303" /LENGTH=47 /DNA_ID= /DNA_START= /DNA_END= /DNA_ORIENTATION=
MEAPVPSHCEDDIPQGQMDSGVASKESTALNAWPLRRVAVFACHHFL